VVSAACCSGRPRVSGREWRESHRMRSSAVSEPALGWIRFNSRKFASPVALTASSPPARKNYCAETALPEAFEKTTLLLLGCRESLMLRSTSVVSAPCQRCQRPSLFDPRVRTKSQR
jgi:hypothetical protein